MASILSWPQCDNSLRLEQSGWHFTGDILKCIPWMKMIVFLMKIFMRSLFRGAQLTIRYHWLWELCLAEQMSGCFLNPLRAKFFRENINIYLHFVWYLHIDTTQVVKILPQIRQEPAYSTLSISWLLMSWRRKEPGHQQPWYWHNKLQWNLKRNSCIFFQENEFENVVCEMASILSRPQCVNQWWPSSLMHINITGPQWVNHIMVQSALSSWMFPYYLFIAKPFARLIDIMWFPPCQWSNPEEFWYLHHANLLTTIENRNKVVQNYSGYMDYLDLAVHCLRKAIKLNHSLTRTKLTAYLLFYTVSEPYVFQSNVSLVKVLSKAGRALPTKADNTGSNLLHHMAKRCLVADQTAILKTLVVSQKFFFSLFVPQPFFLYENIHGLAKDCCNSSAVTSVLMHWGNHSL